jgi:hypothetical protein
VLDGDEETERARMRIAPLAFTKPLFDLGSDGMALDDEDEDTEMSGAEPLPAITPSRAIRPLKKSRYGQGSAAMEGLASSDRGGQADIPEWQKVDISAFAKLPPE